MLTFDDFKKPKNLVAAEKASLTARIPRGDEDVILHPDWVWEEMMIVRRRSGKFCLIHPSVVTKISKRRLSFCDLRAGASSDGSFFVFPVHLEKYEAVKAAKQAIDNWCRIAWKNESPRKYVATGPEGEHDAPSWPFENFGEMVESAFGDHIIDREDHPFLKEFIGS